MPFVFVAVTSSLYWGLAVAKQPFLAELFYNDQWNDVTSSVYTRDDCVITRGRGDETQRVSPSSAELTLKNRDGTYNPRNPLSPLYGLVGRNTPVRLALQPGNTTGPMADAADTFTRSVSNAWGTAETGGAWTTFGAGGAVQASDFQVTGTAGTHYVPAANAYRATYLDDIDAVDVTQAITFSAPVATGAAMSPASFLFRGTSTSSYLMARVFVHTTTAVQVQVLASDASTVLGLATVAGLAHAGTGTPLRAKARVVGRDIFMRVWDPAGAEPDDWDLHVVDTTETPVSGWIGVRSGRSTGNTNTANPQFTYDDYEVTVEDPRLVGEVASWKPQRTVDFAPGEEGGDAWTSIEIGGIMRRLGQGDSPLRSALYRYITGTELVSDGVLLGYWPLEDHPSTTLAANAVPGGSPASVSRADLFTSEDGPPGSSDLPSILGGGRITATPMNQAAPAVGEGWFVTAVFKGSGTTASVTPLELSATGGLPTWRLTITNTAATLTGYNDSGSSVSSASLSADYLDGEWHQVTIWALRGSASGIQVGLYVDDQFDGDSAASSHVLGSLKRILVPGTTAASNMDSAQVGHVLAYKANPSLDLMDDIIEAMNGFSGETAGRRIERLCSEESITFTSRGDLDSTAPMGAQTVATFVNLLHECADADIGMLGEPRGWLGIHYVAHSALYNQAATLELDFTQGHVAPPLDPVIDDQHTRNDVTSKRQDGGSYRAVLESGPMSIESPPDGVGRIASEETVNLASDGQLEDHAGWMLHLGTWDEERYAQVTVDLDANPSLKESVSALECGDVMTIENLAYDDVKLIVQGYTELIGSHRRKLTYNCTPATPWSVAEIEHATLSYIGSDGSTTVADFDAGTDTVLTATYRAGHRWSDDDAPYDIAAAGVVLTVTSVFNQIGGNDLLTVEQTPVNGVTKTIPAGSVVDIYPRSFIGK